MLYKIPELSWGAFIPQFLGFFNNVKGKDVKWFVDLDRGTFFHEAVHYINALSSNYSIHILLECLDAIKFMVMELDGNANGIFSFSMVKPETDYWEHFNQQSKSYEGRYSYDNLDIKEYLADRGYFKENAEELLFSMESLKQSYIVIYNKEAGCHEVLCWNSASEQYFVIPIGIMAMQECQAHINEIIHTSEVDGTATFTLYTKTYPKDSPMHVYTIIFELYNKIIIESEEIKGTDEEKLLFLEFALDISMQMPLFVEEENTNERYIPSAVFIRILDYIQQKKCVPDLREKDNYTNFLEELSEAIGFYPCTKSWNNLYEVINTMLNYVNNDLNRFISKEFLSSYSDKLADIILDIAKQNPVNSHYKKGIDNAETRKEVVNEIVEYLENNKSVMINGNLGGGIIYLLREVLGLRINNPQYFTFPHSHFHKYFDDILPPVVFFNNNPVSYCSTKKYWILRDIQFIKHLWGMYIQKEMGNKTYKCGNQFFGINCKEQHKGCCYEYDPGKRFCKANCEYTDCLSWFKLINR